jgi:hypothetical protein
MNSELERVGLNLNQAVIAFWKMRIHGLNGNGGAILTDNPSRFTANELRQHVQHYHFGTAPASADRVMRQLRAKGKINYALTNRAQSLYTALPLYAEAQQ